MAEKRRKKEEDAKTEEKQVRGRSVEQKSREIMREGKRKNFKLLQNVYEYFYCA